MKKQIEVFDYANDILKGIKMCIRDRNYIKIITVILFIIN